MHEAMLYRQLAQERVECDLCAHRCIILEGRTGVCQVRENQAGRLYSLVYGQMIAQHLDPVEKKPLYHFYPGSTAYSMATPGCNFRCHWCQNADISQMPRDDGFIADKNITPEQVVTLATGAGSRSIAYTYTEPTIFFEYSYDVARLARQAGLANIYVTNGYMTREMLEAFQPYLDAANVDLKAFRDETYRKYVGARLGPVLDSLKLMKQLGVWVEVTTLIIPGLNDDPAELNDLAQFVAGELGLDTPWHVSRFFPTYRMDDVPPTPLATLQHAQEIGRAAGLRYIYAGNQPGESNTACHACGQLLIRRIGYQIVEQRVTGEATCPACGAALAGVGIAGR
jgi:pyruvate formate lyase activating enzyme